ncbi:MAG: hypothetical protein M3Y24_08005 [Acidobacteriota bacterium]|nr:hypothetical protein [Acidobacteriota bacterium]
MLKSFQQLGLRTQVAGYGDIWGERYLAVVHLAMERQGEKPPQPIA